jgi:hypothetical protein
LAILSEEEIVVATPFQLPSSAHAVLSWCCIAMARPMIGLAYMMAMIALIVTVDALIFRNHFWERLM